MLRDSLCLQPPSMVYSPSVKKKVVSQSYPGLTVEVRLYFCTPETRTSTESVWERKNNKHTSLKVFYDFLLVFHFNFAFYFPYFSGSLWHKCFSRLRKCQAWQKARVNASSLWAKIMIRHKAAHIMMHYRPNKKNMGICRLCHPKKTCRPFHVTGVKHLILSMVYL